MIIEGERYTDWKAEWTKFKNMLSEGQNRNKQQSLVKKELQVKYRADTAKTTMNGSNATQTLGKRHQYLRCKNR